MKKTSYLDLFRSQHFSLSLAILTSVSVVALDVLIVNTVLPNILRELGGVPYYAWAVGAYSLGNFLTIPIFSVLEGKLGGRLSIALSLGIFLLGAVLGAMARGMPWIVAGRFLQGMGAGGFFAIPFALINRYYPKELQPRAVGLVSAVWGLAAVAGPLVGATILQFWGWRWVFWINLPWGGLILFLTLWALVREGPPPNPKAKVNFLNPLLFAVATALLLEALGSHLPFNLIIGMTSLVFFLVFFRMEGKASTPMIPADAWRPSLFLGTAFIAMALSAATFGAAETYLPLLLQGLWQSSPVEAGMILTVGSIGWSFTSAGIARFADYPRRLSTLGTLMLLLGLVGITLVLKFQGPLLGIYLSWFISGVGMGMVVPTYNTLAMDQSAKYPQGVATGSLLLSMTWGFALGAPLSGIFAQYGFQEGFNPRLVGLGVLPQTSSDALRMGGLLALGTALVLITLTLFFARRMPRSRV